MEIGTVEQLDIIVKMKDAYLDYAMSVITARALPDVRDGLKPVQRRILYAMEDMGLRHDRPYRKSARIVGEVLGKYHPHGDSPVYEAMVRMAQGFSMRYPLVDGQGNFGSVDGDNAAAMRYTEARLAAIAEEMLVDIDKDTVDFVENFDGSLKEPTVLPSRVPNLLLNGASGIAVGMATNIPPHNLGELCDAIIYLIEKYDKIDDISVDDLLRLLPGPDFPTAGIILGREGIKIAYATGKGRIIVRSKVYTEDLKGGRSRIIVTELPYQVNKAGLIERIASLVRDRRIESIADLRDESDREGMRIVIELKRGEDARATLQQLFKYTPMQTTFGVNMLALVDMAPRLLPLKRALQLFIEHRHLVITRRSRYELERAQLRAHILEGLKIALDYLDAVIDTIRRSRTVDSARKNLMRKFKLTEIQARAILDMQLRRLAAMERKKIDDEYADVIQQIAYLEDLLANPRKILYLIREDMRDVKRTYGDARRTHIVEGEAQKLTAADLLPDTNVLLALTRRGHIARLPVDAARRGKLAKLGISIGARDMGAILIMANTKDTLLLFSSSGKVFQEKVHRIITLDREAAGQSLANLLSLGSREHVTALLPIAEVGPGSFLTMVTRLGRVKRVSIEEFGQIPTVGLAAIKLDDGDELGWVRLTKGDEEIVLVTRNGQAIRFKEDEVRPMGRSAAGVWAIRLAKGDAVAGMGLARDGNEVLIVTEHGYAKRSRLGEYPTQGRYGGGVRAMDVGKLGNTGAITAAAVVRGQGQIALMSTAGNALRIPVSGIPLLKRATWGTLVREGRKALDLREGESVVSIAVLNEEEPQPTRTRKRTPSRRSGPAKRATTKAASASKRSTTQATKSRTGARGRSSTTKASSKSTSASKGSTVRKALSRTRSRSTSSPAKASPKSAGTSRKSVVRKTTTGSRTRSASSAARSSKTSSGSQTTRRRTSTRKKTT